MEDRVVKVWIEKNPLCANPLASNNWYASQPWFAVYGPIDVQSGAVTPVSEGSRYPTTPMPLQADHEDSGEVRLTA